MSLNQDHRTSEVSQESREWGSFSILVGALIVAFTLLVADAAFAAEGDAPAASAAEAPPAAEAGTPKRKSKFQRSQLTRDETEGLADKRRILLSTGEDRAVDLDFEVNAGAAGISIGNPQVVATTLVKIGEQRQLVFKPLKAGETNVTIRDADGTLRLIFSVRVTGTNLLRVAGEVRTLLRDIEGIDIRIVGPKVIIEGEVLVPADFGRMIQVLRDPTYDKLVLNLVSLSPLALSVLAKRIQDDIQTFAQNVKTRVVNGKIFLEGSVDNADQANRAKRVAELYLPELRPASPLENAPEGVLRLPPNVTGLVQNFIVVNPPPPKRLERLVKITVNFVELSKDYNRVFGFKWQPGFSADPTIQIGNNQSGQVGATQASFTGTLSSLFPKLESAQKAGYARVLKTGTLIVRSGQPARLNEQTEFPFLVQQGNGQVAAAKQGVGLVLAVTPQVIGQNDDVQLDLNMNQINLVGRAPSGSAPITSTHAVETKLYIRSGESAAVAAVSSSDVGTDFNKDDPRPGVFQDTGTPGPLFTLMRSKAYRKKKSQFVIFVTPQIIENASEGTDDLKKNYRIKVK